MQGEIRTEAAFGHHGSQEFSVEKLLNERSEYFVFNVADGDNFSRRCGFHRCRRASTSALLFASRPLEPRDRQIGLHIRNLRPAQNCLEPLGGPDQREVDLKPVLVQH
jgi:hypothetical protein